MRTASETSKLTATNIGRLAMTLLLALAGATAMAAPSAPEPILFGQSAALAGPAAALGQSMRKGILAAFSEFNQAGGLHGRPLKLISYDDAYEPESAIANTKKLIEQDRVFALIGEVGTPTSAVAAPIAAAAGVPFIAPYTGAEVLRDGAPPTVVNLRASYFQEAEHIVQWLTADRNLKRIGVLYQDDSFGRAGLSGVVRALQRRNLQLAGAGSYERNTTAVKLALLAIREAHPDAVVIVGSYRPSAQFIFWAGKLGLKSLFVNLSFVGSNALARELMRGGRGLGVTYVSQVVPPPEGDDFAVLAQYRAAMADAGYADALDYVSLEGYLAGRLAIEALRAAQAPLSREGFLNVFNRGTSIDIGGLQFSFGADDNQGSDRVYLTVIDDQGQVKPLPGTGE